MYAIQFSQSPVKKFTSYIWYGDLIKTTHLCTVTSHSPELRHKIAAEVLHGHSLSYEPAGGDDMVHDTSRVEQVSVEHAQCGVATATRLQQSLHKHQLVAAVGEPRAE